MLPYSHSRGSATITAIQAISHTHAAKQRQQQRSQRPLIDIHPGYQPVVYNRCMGVEEQDNWRELHFKNAMSINKSARDKAVLYLIENVIPKIPDEILVEMRDDEKWWTPYHFGMMMQVSNMMRACGCGEDELAVENLDDYAVGLLELAAGVTIEDERVIHEEDSPASEYFIAFYTKDCPPGSIDCIRVKLDMYRQDDMKCPMRLDLDKHPLYPELVRFIKDNPLPK